MLSIYTIQRQWLPQTTNKGLNNVKNNQKNKRKPTSTNYEVNGV
jgi:hypothetical protein